MSNQFGSIRDEFYTKGNQFIYNLYVPDGKTIHRIETAEYNHAFYQFPALVIWKLYVKMASEYQSNAFEICQFFKRTHQKEKTADKKRVYTLATDDPDKSLEYFQSIIAAYIFSFNALEAYVNCRIDSFTPTPQDYVALQQLSKITKAGILLQTKIDLIKECRIQDKLLDIIPYILKVRSISYKVSAKHKQCFENILFIRNELTHHKRLIERSSVKDGTFKTSKLWNRLIPAFKDNKIDLTFHPATFIIEIIKVIEDKFSIPPSLIDKK